MKLSYLDLSSTDAEFNLAAEQYVFDSLPRDRMYCMLWQNRSAVIIGKYQNTAAEVNAEYVRDHAVQVVRRLSGGGAVYHDLGNLNFTFIADAAGMKKLDLQLFCRPVIATLHALGVPAELNGRNDITIDGKKFSGNAQYIRQERVMHHGTLLFDSDLAAVSRALKVDGTKIQAKGVSSVRSRVTNIRPYLGGDIALTDFRALLLSHICGEADAEKLEWSASDLEAIEEIRRQRYARWDWNYGRSPACSMEKKRRIEGCGTVTAYLDAEKGTIRSLAFRGDFFSSLDPSALSARLIGKKFNRDDLLSALQGEDLSLYFSGMTRDALIDLLLY